MGLRPACWFVCVALGSACLALSTAPALAATPRGSVYGPAVVNRAVARRQALRLLRELRLPPESRRVLHGTRARLSKIPDGPSPRGHLIDAHAFWESVESPGEVLRYVAHHLPPGVLLSTRFAGGETDGVGFLGWQLRVRAGLALRAVAVSAVALPSGATAVRLDGEAQWLTPRPSWERVPSEADLATLAGHGAQGTGPKQSRALTLAAHTTRRLAAWIDRQPVAQPGAFTACGLGTESALTVDFRGGAGGLLAQATESVAGGCGMLSLTVAGRTGPSLEDAGLERELLRLHVVPACRASQLTVAQPQLRRAAGEGTCSSGTIFARPSPHRSCCTRAERSP